MNLPPDSEISRAMVRVNISYLLLSRLLYKYSSQLKRQDCSNIIISVQSMTPPSIRQINTTKMCSCQTIWLILNSEVFIVYNHETYFHAILGTRTPEVQHLSKLDEWLQATEKGFKRFTV